MINYHYEKDAFSTFQEGIRREWALTNGIGGYAGMCSEHFRHKKKRRDIPAPVCNRFRHFFCAVRSQDYTLQIQLA